jgi:hypothetical protein
MQEDLLADLDQLKKPEFLEPGKALGDLHWIAGSVGGLLAQGAACDLICNEAKSSGVLTKDQAGVDWKQQLRGCGEPAKDAVLHDFEHHIQKKLMMSMPPPILGNFTWDLALYDLCMLMTLGSDSVWPELSLAEQVGPTFSKFRLRYLDWLPKALRQGGWINERGELDWPLNSEAVAAEAVPWLPEAFWWRHLPDLIGDLVPVRTS